MSTSGETGPKEDESKTGSAAAMEGTDAIDLTKLASKARPTRPLSAYNLYFQAERKNMLDILPVRAKGKPRHSHGKIGFADLARKIAAKWKSLNKEERMPFDTQAAVEKKRYERELKEWKREQEIVKRAIRRQHEQLAKKNAEKAAGAPSSREMEDAAIAEATQRSSMNQPIHRPTMGGFSQPRQAMDDFSGSLMHPYQQIDPAMLSSNTQPSVASTRRTMPTSNDFQQNYSLPFQRRFDATYNPFSTSQSNMTGMPLSDYGLGRGDYLARGLEGHVLGQSGVINPGGHNTGVQGHVLGQSGVINPGGHNPGVQGQGLGQAGMTNPGGYREASLFPLAFDTQGLQQVSGQGGSSLGNQSLRSFAASTGRGQPILDSSNQYNPYFAAHRNQERMIVESNPLSPRLDYIDSTGVQSDVSRWNQGFTQNELGRGSGPAQQEQMQHLYQLQLLQQQQQQQQQRQHPQQQQQQGAQQQSQGTEGMSPDEMMRFLGSHFGA